MKRVATIAGVLLATSCVSTKLSTPEDHPAHPDAPTMAPPPAPTTLSENFEVEESEGADEPSSSHEHHHHHHGGEE